MVIVAFPVIGTLAVVCGSIEPQLAPTASAATQDPLFILRLYNDIYVWSKMLSL